MVSKEIRNALERDPPTPYVSPCVQQHLRLANGEPTSSNIVRYLDSSAAYQRDSWNLSVRVEADFIYLKEDERRLFAM